MHCIQYSIYYYYRHWPPIASLERNDNSIDIQFRFHLMNHFSFIFCVYSVNWIRSVVHQCWIWMQWRWQPIQECTACPHYSFGINISFFLRLFAIDNEYSPNRSRIAINASVVCLGNDPGNRKTLKILFFVIFFSAFFLVFHDCTFFLIAKLFTLLFSRAAKKRNLFTWKLNPSVCLLLINWQCLFMLLQ